jgi:transcriptional regulator with XRE-family HTH domain
MDVLKHIDELMKQRGWSINHLAKQADMPQSTLSGLYQRNNCPTIPTLEKICDAFGITMSEFFAPDNGLTALTEEQRILLDKWDSLPHQHKEAVLKLIESL